MIVTEEIKTAQRLANDYASSDHISENMDWTVIVSHQYWASNLDGHGERPHGGRESKHKGQPHRGDQRLNAQHPQRC